MSNTVLPSWVRACPSMSTQLLGLLPTTVLKLVVARVLTVLGLRLVLLVGVGGAAMWSTCPVPWQVCRPYPVE